MRKFAAMLILLAYIAFCIVFLATLGTWMTGWNKALQLLFYVLAGFIWIIPLKPLFVWMNKGQKPEDP